MQIIDLKSGELITIQPRVNSAIWHPERVDLFLVAQDDFQTQFALYSLQCPTKPVSQFSLHIPALHEDILAEQHKLFCLSALPNGNILAFASYFSEKEDFEQNFGKTIMFWLRGAQIDPSTNTDTLISNGSIKAFFWSDLDHMSDEVYPMVNVQWLAREGELLVIAQLNHCDNPYYARIKDDDLVECYEFTSMQKPHVLRPKNAQGEEMESVDVLGCCLGFALHTSKIAGAPETFDITLVDEEEEYYWPPTLFMMSLDGTVRYW